MSTNYLTEAEARTVHCGGPDLCGTKDVNKYGELTRMCEGSKCMNWRWQPLMVTAEWIAAVRKRADEMKEQTPGRPKAAAYVNAHRSEFNLPDQPFRGYCGLAGKPEV